VLSVTDAGMGSTAESSLSPKLSFQVRVLLGSSLITLADGSTGRYPPPWFRVSPCIRYKGMSLTRDSGVWLIHCITMLLQFSAAECKAPEHDMRKNGHGGKGEQA
jgi:hypothetical protein